MINLHLKIFVLVASCFRKGDFLLVQETDCVCPGYAVDFKCTVLGSGSTVWKGTAFQCSDSDGSLILRHSQFVNRTDDKVCSDGAVVARPLQNIENFPQTYYMSQLRLTVGLETNNKSVQCAHDNGTEENIVGTITVSITSGALPPPENISLADRNSKHLIFSWRAPLKNCVVVQYQINATNCGDCPMSTNETSVICSNPMFSEEFCSFAVQTVVCSNIIGSFSEPIIVQFRRKSYRLNVSIIEVIPVYSQIDSDTNKLALVSITINNTEYLDALDISSFISHTVNLVDMSSSESCGSSDISTTSCQLEICSITFNISLLSCRDFADIEVTVVTATSPGDIFESYPLLLRGANTNFTVQYVSDPRSIKCVVKTHEDNLICHIRMISTANNCTYPGLSQELPDSLFYNMTQTADVSFLESGTMFCFVAVAKGKTSSYMAILEGSFTVDSQHESCFLSADVNDPIHEIPVVIISSLVIALFLLLVFVIIGQIIKLKKRCTKLMPSSRQVSRPIQSLDAESTSEHTQNFSMLPHVIENVNDDPQLAYAEIGNLQKASLRIIPDKDEVEYAKINYAAECPEICVVPECNLDNVLIQIRSQATPKWHQLGLVVGVVKEILDQYSKYPNEECIVEVIDYWFRNGLSTPTWRHVAEALKEIELYDLAESILKVYESGKLPTEIDH